ncbi:MAG: ParM/StbA family protein [Ferrovum myxofaciens]
MEHHNVIGLDIGHSTVKVAYANLAGEPQTIIFPSAVSPAIEISDDSESKRAQDDTVTIAGNHLFIGDTAEVQGRRNTQNNVSETWIESMEYQALTAGAIKKLIQAGANIDQSTMVVVGLPTSLYKSQRDKLRELTQKIVGYTHEVKVLPQSLGAFQSIMFDQDGQLAQGRSLTSESWGVIEVGYFSTDFMVMRGHGGKARWIEDASGICSGVRFAAERLSRILSDELKIGGKSITVTPKEAESALITGHIRYYGKINVADKVKRATSIITEEVMRAASRYLESEAATLDGIVLAGGGSPLVSDAIKNLWPHVVTPENPRFTVAEGFRRFGVGILRARVSV